MTPFQTIILILGCSLFALGGCLLFAVWRLGSGIHAIIRMVPAITMLDTILSHSKQLPKPKQPEPEDEPPLAASESRVDMPFDAARMGVGTFTEPSGDYIEMAEKLMRRQ